MRAAALRRGALAVAALLTVAGTASACGGDSASSDGPVKLRLGYFPNVTHATAIVGVQDGIFAKALGDGVKLSTKTFNAGPAAVEALFSDALDISYIGPGPATNAYAKSKGQAVRVIAGATSGGAALVVKPDITSVEQLEGKKIATPQLGNTQDIALRYWLKEKGLKTTKEGGGDVSIAPQENAQTLETFKNGQIDGAWVPEPWAYRLQQAGGKVLVDERDLWPDKRFVTTHVIVRTEFLKEHPDVVKKFLAGHVEATDQINADPAAAQKTVGDGITTLTGKSLKAEIIAGSWKTLEFTDDPIASSLVEGAKHAIAVDLLKPVDNLENIYDLDPLNEVLKEQSKEQVSSP
jgi:NitT/TauT family transport system substrate-binding protein